MQPLPGALVVALLGWLAGGLANLAADVLPFRGAEGGGLRLAGVGWPLHVLTLPWYFFRWGICPHCGERRPVRAPLVELASILLFVAASLWFHDAPVVSLVTAGLAIPFFLAVIVIDIEHRRVLNVMLLPAAVVATALSLLPGGVSPLQAVLGGAAGLGLFLLAGLVSRGKMGAGDIKLAAVIGLMTGFPAVLTALLLGILLGGVGALALLLTRRAGLKSYIAYAPYLAVGAMVALAMGR